MWSKKHKFLFIHNQKCAGRSIKVCLNRTFDRRFLEREPQGHGHWSINQFKYYINDDINDYTKFICVRNPWEKIVSLYYHFKKHDLYDKSFGLFCREAYLQELTIQSKAFIKNKLAVDYVIRFENLQEDFDTLMGQMNITDYPKLTKENHQVNRLGCYRDKYNIKTKEIIGNIFSKEIEMFNYKF